MRKTEGLPIKKPTSFMSNCEHILKKLDSRCTGRHGQCSNGLPHAPCSGRDAREAATYSKKLCRAMLEGMRDQLRELNLIHEGSFGMQNATLGDEDPFLSLRENDKRYTGRYQDDISGQTLRDDLVEEARRKELDYFKGKEVWTKISRTAATWLGCKPISVRWVDSYKGDEVEPNYRSRLVARQLIARD